MRRFVLVSFAAVLAGCATRELPVEIDRFREALSDPERYAIRDGLTIDEEAIRAAAERFAREHEAVLDSCFRASLDELPEGAPPEEPAFRTVAQATAEQLAAAKDFLRYQWVFFPKADYVARAGILPVLPAIMSESDRLPPQQIGAWIGFFSWAKPALSVHERRENRVTLIADYGGVDILVVTLERDDGGWSPAALAWWQAAVPSDEP